MLNLSNAMEDEIEKMAIKAKDDRESYERLAEMMLPTMNHLLDYFKFSYPSMDESIIFFNLNAILEYCVEKYRPDQGKFIYFWRFVARTTISRNISKLIVKRKHQSETIHLSELPNVYGEMMERMNNRISSEVLMHIFEMEDEYSPSDNLKSMTLLWALGCSSQEIAPLFGISPLAVRRGIKKVQIYVKSKLEQ